MLEKQNCLTPCATPTPEANALQNGEVLPTQNSTALGSVDRSHALACGAQPNEGGMLVPAQPGGGTAEQDAPPSNTASNSYRDTLDFTPLRWGVDSLYLSYPGELSKEMDQSLQELKKAAQSSEPHEQVMAQVTVNGHIFEVKDKGAPLFPYILEDNAYRIQLSRPGRKAPMAYVKLSSAFLNHVGPEKGEQGLRAILDTMGEIKESANISRIDLYVDFVSHVPMDGWGRGAWITRASSIHNYSENGVFTGWMIGAGGVLSFRLYNKTQELKRSKKDYLKPLWHEAGWDGELPVWRAEFQFRREVLAQLGVVKLHGALHHLNGLWSYGTDEWLRLAIPDPEDSNRSRWPIHPLWQALASIDWDTPGGSLTKRFAYDRAPGEEWVNRAAFSAVTSFMAKEGLFSFQEGWETLGMSLYNQYSSRAIFEGIPFDQYLREKVQAKARKYNTLFNLDVIPNEDELRAELDAQADAYRRASEGY